MACSGLLEWGHGLHADVDRGTLVWVLLRAPGQADVASRLLRHHHPHRDLIFPARLLWLYVPALLAQCLPWHYISSR